MKLPSFLNGKTVLITREEQDSREFAREIERHGAIPTSIPMISFKASPLSAEDQMKLASSVQYDWIIFTSKKGVQFFFQHVGQPHLGNIAVIGDKTSVKLAEYGYESQFIPSKFVAECFVEEFIPLITASSKILVVKGNLARDLIAEKIRMNGSVCDEIIIYENVMPTDSEEKLIEMFSTHPFDIITFTSSSTVHNFMSIVKKNHLKEQLASTMIACIGPIVAATAEQYGLQVDVCADVYTMEGLLHSLINFEAQL